VVRRVWRPVVVALALLALPAGAMGQPADTPAARRDAALQYLASVPIETIVDDMVAAVAQQLPAARRDEFVRLMRKLMPVDTMKSLTVDGVVKHFTVAEIDAMTKFYGSTEGKSIMKKLGPYMGDLMPQIQNEVLRAIEKVRAEMEI
jgi:hypothetical protein